MYRVRVATVALAALFVVASLSQAADKGDKKKAGGVAGTVKSVDASAKTITVSVKNKKETEDKTFAVADDVKVTINGESKTLGDVEEGAKARFKLSEDGKTVMAISVGKKKKNA
jgi:hypothetical protein